MVLATGTGAMSRTRAPNRPFDLTELKRPSFQRVLSRLDALVRREDVSYLHPSKRWEYPWALERAALSPGSRVLDAGSGASIFPVYLAGNGHRVTAVDRVLPGRLDRLHDVRVHYAAGDLRMLPFAGSAFDAVFCISVLEHLLEAQIPVALREMRRVLRPGGRLLLTTDFYEDASAELWYETRDRRFRVDWTVFDEPRLRRDILDSPGFRIEGEVDLAVDWERVRPRMREFHGYPYTAVGVMLSKR